MFFGIGALVFLAGGLPVLLDGSANIAMIAQADAALEGVTKSKVYEILNGVQDEQVRHIGFWFAVMYRSMGAFQTAVGAAIITVIAAVPVRQRAAAHFIYAGLDLAVGLVEMQVGLGLPGLGVDTAAMFPGITFKMPTKQDKKKTKEQQVAPAETQAAVPDAATAGKPRPPITPYAHFFFFLVHAVLGACILIV